MNLTGRWKGEYTYGNNYPISVAGKSEPFEFEIEDNNGTISGICIDNVVKAVHGNKAIIEGTFKNDFITFVKRYKYHLSIDENGDQILEENVSTDGVQYVGHLKKKWLSGTQYFIGEWQIVVEYINPSGLQFTNTCDGTWSMRKA